jgi:uncharacterized SAM-binding protein YcdF (DUF218 family)
MKERRLRGLFALRLFMAVVLLIIFPMWITRNNWLPSLCLWLDVSKNPVKADFVAYMGGEEKLRPERAAQLYKEGYATRVIASGYYKSVPTGIKVLQENGVPLQSILINDDATTTWDESQQILAMLRKEGASSALIVSNASHMRRASATFEKNQNDQRVLLTFISAETKDQCASWWTTKEGKEPLLYEYPRILFYFFRYGVLSF